MTRPVFLAGEKVDLCPLESDGDLSEYLAWINDQQTTRYMATGKRPTSRKSLCEYIDRYNASKDLLLSIVIKATGQHIGNITLHSIDAQNSTGEIGILVGDPGARGQGYASEALRLLVHHAFQRLNLNKLTAGLIVGNRASQRLFEKAGFKLEGTLREQFYLDGKYLDGWRYGLLRREFLEGGPRGA